MCLGLNFFDFSALLYRDAGFKDVIITNVKYEVMVRREVYLVFYGRAETSTGDFLGLWKGIEAHSGGRRPYPMFAWESLLPKLLQSLGDFCAHRALVPHSSRVEVFISETL